MDKVDMRKLFISLQRQMINNMATYRTCVSHPSAKGDACEFNWIEWMRSYLPKRYSIDKAFVIDSDNNRSEQIDIVIYDRQYSPFIFDKDSIKFIPAESIYAVFEVRQKLTKGNIEYAGEKAESVRRLKRTTISIPYAGGAYNAKQPFRVLAGILALESSWKEPFGRRFRNCISSADEDKRLDLGCALRHGSFRAFKEDAEIKIETGTKEEALIYFFIKLFMELQRLATVPAMDIESYAKALDSIKRTIYS